MSKFTPGPWVITDIDNLPDGGKWIDISDDAYAIPIVSVRSKDHDANAALIAAAPDLYDAACNALDTFLACVVPAGGVDDQKSILDAGTMLMAAIAKAEGKQ